MPDGGRVGCEAPRLWTPPLRRLTRRTSAGWECIAFAEEVLGVDLFPWQRWLLVHALELRGDGSYRFRTVVLLVARQAGKSTLMTVLALWRMYVDRAPLVIGTAQNLDVAEEQWDAAVEMAQSVPDLAAEVEQVTRVNGKKAIRLVTGERYKVAAASRRGGRGLSGDLVLLDELREHHNWDAWAAVTKTTMARARAQTWTASTAGDRQSVVLDHLRSIAHAELGNPDGLDLRAAAPLDDGDELDVGLFEWSACPGCDVWDRDEWAQANPSLGHPNGIGERAVASAARTDPEDVFRTEVLCQFVDRLPGASHLPLADWLRLADAGAPRGARPVFGVDVGADRLAHVAVASRRGDGHVQVMLADSGVSPLRTPARLVQLARDWGGTVALGGASAVLEGDLAGVKVGLVSGADFAAGCGRLADLVAAGEVRHGNQPVLNAAVDAARFNAYGTSGERSLQLRDAPEAGPLAAVVRALHGLLATPKTPPPAPLIEKRPRVERDGWEDTLSTGDIATMRF